MNEITLELIDGVSGQVCKVTLSEEDAARAVEDMEFATKILRAHQAAIGTVTPDAIMDVAADDYSNKDNDPGTDVGASSSSASEQEIASDKDNFRWPNEAVLMLVHEYREAEDKKNSGKMTAKKFWEMIAKFLNIKGGFSVTGTQCKSKLNGLKNTYKSVKEHNNKSGNNLRTWCYYELMDNLFGSKPWVEPVSSFDTGRQSESSSLPTKHNRSPPKSPEDRPSKRLKSQQNGLDKLIAVIEAQREEKKKQVQASLERQDRLIALLEKIANNGGSTQ